MVINKRFWIGILALAILLVAGFFYLNYRNYSLSPRGEEQLTSNGLTVTVKYCRPSVRGRVIFGGESQNALQEYGEYWRLGANEATEITITRQVMFNDKPLKPGTYRMYAIPGKDQFEIALNSELDKWGAFEPDYKLDALRTKVPVQEISNPVEQFTISLAPDRNGMNMVFEWSDTRFSVPIQRMQ